jgi:hypothetical protein
MLVTSMFLKKGESLGIAHASESNLLDRPQVVPDEPVLRLGVGQVASVLTLGQSALHAASRPAKFTGLVRLQARAVPTPREQIMFAS